MFFNFPFLTYSLYFYFKNLTLLSISWKQDRSGRVLHEKEKILTHLLNSPCKYIIITFVCLQFFNYFSSVWETNDHRITESPWLENISKIIQSNHSPTTNSSQYYVSQYNAEKRSDGVSKQLEP